MKSINYLAVAFLTTSLAACTQAFAPLSLSAASQSSNGLPAVSATPLPDGSMPSPGSPSDGSSPVPAPGGSHTSQIGVVAIPANDFLNSLGVNTHIDQGYNTAAYVAPINYVGIRQIRDSIRNLDNSLMLHQKTGVKFAVSAGGALDPLLAAARTLAQNNALLALEGPNEANNFPITYNGQTGGGSGSWQPVANFQRDLYSSVKGDAALKGFPVFADSEAGAETSDMGLQFLTIPAGAASSMPAGTKYADYANPHNYVCGTQGQYEDNQAWRAADPTLRANYDGLSVEYGLTWNGNHVGYTNAQLETLPRVTTETGWVSDSAGGETRQGTVLLNTFFSQFKRGWSYTFVYELVDDEGGGGKWGFFRSDYSAKPSANYLHNATTILADTSSISQPGKLNYSIPNQASTVHDLLLQKSDGTFELVVWGEAVSGSQATVVNLGALQGTVNVYDTTVAATPVMTYANVSSVTVQTSDHALIIEVK